jgi:hypothetical protein
MEQKLARLIELRKQKQSIETEIGQLVTELTSIIQPKKRKAKVEKLPQAKL